MCWPSSSTWPRARSSRATRNAWPGPSSSSPPPWTRNWRAWTALKAVNPSVRDSELDSLRTQREEGPGPARQGLLRLEAIRILVAG
ncbi:hypothetical protein ACPA9J_31710 [Pseudomonas aeruginosa]